MQFDQKSLKNLTQLGSVSATDDVRILHNTYI